MSASPFKWRLPRNWWNFSSTTITSALRRATSTFAEFHRPNVQHWALAASLCWCGGEHRRKKKKFNWNIHRQHQHQAVTRRIWVFLGTGDKQSLGMSLFGFTSRTVAAVAWSRRDNVLPAMTLTAVNSANCAAAIAPKVHWMIFELCLRELHTRDAALTFHSDAWTYVNLVTITFLLRHCLFNSLFNVIRSCSNTKKTDQKIL